MEVIYKNPKVIAEIGCNHRGDVEIAKKMIDFARDFCDVFAVKFQKRNNKELLSTEQYNAKHPVPYNSYGETYGEHREFLEFNLNQHKELYEYCIKRGIIYSCSVWDMTSAKEIASLNPQFIKIPSASNNHMDMIEWLCENYDGEIHISLGMTTREEEERLLTLLREKNRIQDVVLYACTSGYPVPFEDVCLLEIRRLYNAYGKEVKEIGFSGHHSGKSIDIAAYALGASIVERHFTLDRTWKGTDHAASLEPEGIRRLKINLQYTYEAMNYKKEEILPIEKVQREKLKYHVNKLEK